MMKNTNMSQCIYLKASCEMTNALLGSVEGFIVRPKPPNQEMTAVIYSPETLLKIPSFLQCIVSKLLVNLLKTNFQTANSTDQHLGKWACFCIFPNTECPSPLQCYHLKCSLKAQAIPDLLMMRSRNSGFKYQGDSHES